MKSASDRLLTDSLVSSDTAVTPTPMLPAVKLFQDPSGFLPHKNLSKLLRGYLFYAFSTFKWKMNACAFSTFKWKSLKHSFPIKIMYFSQDCPWQKPASRTVTQISTQKCKLTILATPFHVCLGEGDEQGPQPSPITLGDMSW